MIPSVALNRPLWAFLHLFNTAQTPKTGKARAIILPLRATVALECQRTLTGNGEYVFCSGSLLCPFQTGEAIKHDVWRRWLTAAGLSYRMLPCTRSPAGC